MIFQVFAKRNNEQFSIRVSNYLAKIERMKAAFEAESSIPEELFAILEEQENSLKELKARTGKDQLAPSYFENE